MSQLSKNELKAENQSQFPNNNIGAITPSHLRAFNVDFIDSTVNQTTFNAYSASVEAQISALDPSGSAESILALNAFTASQLNINSGVNSFTQSIDGRVDALEAATSSYATSAITASSLITASFDNGTRNLTFTKGDSSTFNVNIPDVSGSSGNFVTTSSFNAFTQSIDSRVDSLEAATSSYAISSSVAAVDAAQQAQINALIAFTGSVTASIDTGSFATTGSNTFTGNQTITTGGNTQLNIISTDPNGQTNIDFQSANSNFRAYGLFQINNNGQYGGSGSIQILAKNNNIILAADNGFQLGQTNGVGNGIGAGAVTINVPTGSNTLQLTGSLIVSNQITASNTLFNGDVTINPNTSTKLNGNTDVGAFLYVNSGITLGSTGAAITWLGSGSIDGNFSSSVATQFAAISPTSTGSLLVTASAAGATITFTKGDGSTFDVSVATGSVASASFAETASLAINAKDIVVDVKNTTGAQINKGSVVRIIGAVGDNPLIGTASWDNDGTSANTLGFVVADIANDAFGRVMTQGTLLEVNTDPALGFAAGQLVYLSSSGQFTNVPPPAPYHEVRLGQVLRAQQNNGSIYVLVQNGYELSELHDVDINTGSLANNDLLAYNSSTLQWENKTLTEVGGVTTASFNAITGAFATTGSNNFIGVETIGDVAGTGFGEVYLLGRSGSLIIGNSTATPTYAALAHITSSQINANTNLIFKTNSNTGTTIVSGSANIFVNPTTPTTGYIRYIGGTSNLFLNGQAQQLPQITGSAASVSGNRPTMNSNFIAGPQVWNINQSVNPGTHTYSHNIINGTSAMNFNMLGNTGAVTFGQNILSSPNFTINSPSQSVANVLAGITGSNALTITSNLALAGQIQYQGPVSSSTHTIQNNTIQGALLANLQSGSRTYSIAANSINGTLSITDNTVFAPTLGSANSYSNNIINGAVIVGIEASSSLSLINNNLNGVTITNRLDASGVTAAAQRNFAVTGNALFGASNSILASGSMGVVGVGRQFAQNLIAGAFISASLVGDGTSNSMGSVSILGAGLNVTGSSTFTTLGVPATNLGSTFIGRYNSEDGNKAKTAETIFAVGTGVSGSFRKTGFLIDSGSNTFVEGTLNVSGSSSFNGDMDVTGSLVATKVGAHDFDTLFYGSQLGGTTSQGTFFGYGSNNYTFTLGAYAGGFDNELQILTDSSGIYFGDFNGSGYTPFMTLAPNSGNNLPPRFPRGFQVSGSMDVSGSIAINSGSYNGQAITNITPVSSSLSPILNIVTMTSAEYALITPNSQTLYVIV